MIQSFLFSPSLPSQGICRFNGCIKLIRRYIRHHVMDRLSVSAGFFCNHADLLFLTDADLRKGDGKSYLQAEILNLTEFFL